VPHPNEREPNPPYGYVVSFIRFHERGFATPASCFMRALCYHYGVELHNFTPNTISQAATFVGMCEGFLGIPVNWDIWVHLFRAELHTLTTPEPKIRRAVRIGGMTIALRNTCREYYIPCTMTSNNAEWERGWFYLCNEGAGLPSYSGKVLKDRADSWHHGVSPPSHQTWLDSLLAALKALADGGLTAGCVLANLHHRRIVPLMERPLRIFEMHEDANPVALAQSRLLPDLFPREYAATRARHAIDLRVARSDDAVLWAFAMLPIGPLVSGVPPFLVRGFQACGPRWGTRPPGPRRCRRPTTPLNRSWRSCGPPPSRPARRLGKAGRKLGARWQAACALLAGTFRGGCAALFTWASRRPSAW
jgi:hypothetical protein